MSPHAAGFWGSSQLRLDCQCSCSTRQDAEGGTRLAISAWAQGKLAWVTEGLPQTCPHLPFQTACILSRVRLCVTLWAVACQVPLSTGFSRQEYWRGLPFPYLGDLPDPGINPVSLTSLAFAGEFFTLGLPRMSFSKVVIHYRVTSLGFEI